VEFVHLGRISLMYRTLDGSEPAIGTRPEEVGPRLQLRAEAIQEACASRARMARPSC